MTALLLLEGFADAARMPPGLPGVEGGVPHVLDGRAGLLFAAPAPALRVWVEYVMEVLAGETGLEAVMRDIALPLPETGEGERPEPGPARQEAERLRAVRCYAYAPPGMARLAGPMIGEIALCAGRVPAQALRARLGMIRTRAAARLRGREHPAPASLRRDWGREAVQESARRLPWAGFFTVEQSDLCFRRFDGTMSAPVERAGFVSGDAAIVLPYDPARDLVLLIEQFRYGPFLRDDARPWTLEPIAGRIDGGESPEEAARREAREEAGLELEGLELVSASYPSPGANSEFFYCYVGLASLDTAMQGVGGLEAEAEDIQSHVIGFARLMELVSSGEANCGPLVLLALWLQANRPRLRART